MHITRGIFSEFFKLNFTYRHFIPLNVIRERIFIFPESRFYILNSLLSFCLVICLPRKSWIGEVESLCLFCFAWAGMETRTALPLLFRMLTGMMTSHLVQENQQQKTTKSQRPRHIVKFLHVLLILILGNSMSTFVFLKILFAL